MSYHPYQSHHPAPYPPPRGLSIASLVLGIVSILGLWVTVLAPLAGVITGHMGYARERQGRPMALAGLILSWISLVLALLALGLVIWLVYVSVTMFDQLYPVSDYTFA